MRASSRYVDRIKTAYPIHPELFDRLYEDWSTLERFQRTRGVLRLMAAVIHALWESDDQLAADPAVLGAARRRPGAARAGRQADDYWEP